MKKLTSNGLSLLQKYAAKHQREVLTAAKEEAVGLYESESKQLVSAAVMLRTLQRAAGKNFDPELWTLEELMTDFHLEYKDFNLAEVRLAIKYINEAFYAELPRFHTGHVYIAKTAKIDFGFFDMSYVNSILLPYRNYKKFTLNVLEKKRRDSEQAHELNRKKSPEEILELRRRTWLENIVNVNKSYTSQHYLTCYAGFVFNVFKDAGWTTSDPEVKKEISAKAENQLPEYERKRKRAGSLSSVAVKLGAVTAELTPHEMLIAHYCLVEMCERLPLPEMISRVDELLAASEANTEKEN